MNDSINRWILSNIFTLCQITHFCWKFSFSPFLFTKWNSTYNEFSLQRCSGCDYENVLCFLPKYNDQNSTGQQTMIIWQWNKELLREWNQLCHWIHCLVQLTVFFHSKTLSTEEVVLWFAFQLKLILLPAGTFCCTATKDQLDSAAEYLIGHAKHIKGLENFLKMLFRVI